MQLMWVVIKVVIAIGEKKNAETLELMGSIRRWGGEPRVFGILNATAGAESG